MFPNNKQVTEEIKREIKKISRNKWQWKQDNSKHDNYGWDAMKAVLRGKFIVI